MNQQRMLAQMTREEHFKLEAKVWQCQKQSSNRMGLGDFQPNKLELTVIIGGLGEGRAL